MDQRTVFSNKRIEHEANDFKSKSRMRTSKEFLRGFQGSANRFSGSLNILGMENALYSSDGQEQKTSTVLMVLLMVLLIVLLSSIALCCSIEFTVIARSTIRNH